MCSGMQLKRKLGVGAKEEEVKRKRKCVQPGSRLVYAEAPASNAFIEDAPNIFL